MRPDRPAALLFACFFAAQASFLTLSPVLPDVAREFGVSIATAGQLHTVAGASGAIVALVLTAVGERVVPSRLLLAGLTTLAVASVWCAAAPSYALFLPAEALLGAGLATAVTGGVAAVPAWSAEERRSRTLAWALLGQPGAWVLGMPLIGAVAGVSWRLAFLAVPLTASVIAAAGVKLRAKHRPDVAREQRSVEGVRAWRRPAIQSYVAGEVLASSAWSGTLVYAGARLHDGDGMALATVGLVLGAVAVAYFPATLVARKALAASARGVATGTALVAAAGVAALGAVEDTPATSVTLLALLMAVVGARGLAGAVLGLQAAPDRPVEVSGLRSATVQVGAIVGAALGGLALGAGGWSAWGATLAVLFTLSAITHGSMGAGTRPAARRLHAPWAAEASGVA